jgi:putative ATPase
MSAQKPLPARIRPKSLDSVFGQEHLTDKNGFLAQCIASGNPASVIFWGPPGCGKTTLAKIYAASFKVNLVQISAISTGVAELKKIVADAKGLHENGALTMLFVDEIHRFNKSQQDFFLPYVEDGTIILVGATTENPSFELNNALLSRVQILILNNLDESALEKIMATAEAAEKKLPLDKEARQYLVESAGGDGRYLLNLIEYIFSLNKKKITLETLTTLMQKRFSGHDKSGDSHYNLISALHKSVRGSDPDASLYWLARMLEGGENPLYLARRLIRIASEDIGLADPQALVQANAAREAFQILGSPEGELALAQCVVYLALAPKSNAVYKSFNQVVKDVKKSSELPPPKHILNAPTQMMKDMGYGDFYQYDHDIPNCFSGQNYFPEKIGRQKYYKPQPRGFEREMEKRIAYFEKLRHKAEVV